MLYQHLAAVPPETAASLPPIDLLRQVLAGHVIEIPAGHALVRAAWNSASVFPETVNRTYRFGPHSSLGAAGRYPFHWIYAAEDAITAAWEAQLCINPATLPGRFFIERDADKALLATLAFKQPLRLFDLAGVAASTLGIYDQLRGPEYAWCQWFGVQLDQLLVEHDGRIQGFVYPSRRRPGALTYAISSRVWHPLSLGLQAKTVAFGDTPDFARLRSDPCYIERSQL